MAKLERRRLERLLSRLGAGLGSSEVLVGPAYGEDAAVIRVGCGRVLVAHPDPISGALRNLGMLSIHVPANDVAVTGAEPKYFLMTVLLPPGSDVDSVLDNIISGGFRGLKGVRRLHSGRAHGNHGPR